MEYGIWYQIWALEKEGSRNEEPYATKCARNLILRKG
jgi:hypothetical protein